MSTEPRVAPTPVRRSPQRNRRVWCLTALAGVVLMAAARGPAIADPEVQQDIESILSRTGWRSSTWGVLAVSLDYGDTLVAVNAEEPLIPASNVKLLTTAAALHYLGPDFRYRTYLLSDGPVVGGVLRGDLTLYGTGDPALSWRFADSRTAVMEALADSLVAAGVRRIDGDVVGDASYFPPPGQHPSWDPRDLDDWFAAPAAALSFNENVVTLRVVPGEVGRAPVVHTLPPKAEVPIQNAALTVAGRPSRLVTMARADGVGPIVVSGEIRSGARDRWDLVSVADPALFAAGALRQALSERGIMVSGRTRGVSDPSASILTGRTAWPDSTGRAPRALATHHSPPLIDLLAVTNKSSHNLYAELILRTLGRHVMGDGSFEGGTAAVERFMLEEAGVPPGSVDLADGSGLSRDNRVSAAAFVRALGHMAQSDLWEPLWESLPQAGGRELRRMNRSAAEDNLRAKTGTLSSVSALSGQLRTVEGERVLFSILQNGVPSPRSAKYIEDRLSVRLATFRRSGGGAPVELRGNVGTGSTGSEDR